MTVTIGVIGSGNFGRQLIKAFHETGLCRIKSIAARTPSKHRDMTEKYGAAVTDDYTQLLRDEAIDAISVCGPLELQAAMVEEALAAGKHVLMEKPLAATMEDALRIKAAADASDKLAMVGFIERFNPALLRIKTLLRQDYLGKVFRLSIKRGSRLSERTPWMWEVGMYVHILGHNIDILRWFLDDEVEHVYSESDGFMRANREEADNICCMLRFRRGAIAVMEDSWTLSPKMPMEENDCRLDLIGEKGNLSTNMMSQMTSMCCEDKGWFYPSVLRWPGGLEEDGGVVSYALKDECAYFLRAVRDRNLPPLSTVDSAFENLRVAMACRLSSREGRRVHMSEIEGAGHV